MSFNTEPCLKVKSVPTQRAPDPRTSTGVVMVGVCTFSGTLCGLELVPSKWRYLISPTSTPEGHNASRWGAPSNLIE